MTASVECMGSETVRRRGGGAAVGKDCGSGSLVNPRRWWSSAAGGGGEWTLARLEDGCWNDDSDKGDCRLPELLNVMAYFSGDSYVVL